MIRLIRSFPNEATVTDQRYDEIDGLTELNTLERDHYTGIREGRMINFPLSGKNTLEIGYKVTTYTHKVNVEYNLVSYTINQHILGQIAALYSVSTVLCNAQQSSDKRTKWAHRGGGSLSQLLTKSHF